MSVVSKLLALALFGTLSKFAFDHTIGTLNPPVAAHFAAICPVPYSGPNTTIAGDIYTDQASLAHLTYTGIPLIDWRLCQLTNFFLEALKPDAYPVTLTLVSSITPYVLFTFLESARNSHAFNLVLNLPAIYGLLYQNFTGAVILPIYYALFILSGSVKRSHGVSRKQALAVLLGVALGHGAPAFSMLNTRAPLPATAWQIFPLLVSLIQSAVSHNAPSSRTFRSGKKLIQFSYILSLLASSLHHLSVIASSPGFTTAIFNLYVPQFQAVGAANMSHVAKQFLQWDGLFIYSSGALFTLWFAESVYSFIGILLTNVVMMPLFGPGTSFAAVMIWREGL